MSNISRMTGTPWHTEKMTRKEDDTRRHRSRCIYFNSYTKNCHKKTSPYYMKTCAGSAHCSFYTE